MTMHRTVKKIVSAATTAANSHSATPGKSLGLTWNMASTAHNPHGGRHQGRDGRRANTTCVTYRTYRHSKQAETANIRGTSAISATGPVFLRSSRDSCRVIRPQDRSMLRPQAAPVFA